MMSTEIQMDRVFNAVMIELGKAFPPLCSMDGRSISTTLHYDDNAADPSRALENITVAENGVELGIITVEKPAYVVLAGKTIERFATLKEALAALLLPASP